MTTNMMIPDEWILTTDNEFNAQFVLIPQEHGNAFEPFSLGQQGLLTPSRSEGSETPKCVPNSISFIDAPELQSQPEAQTQVQQQSQSHMASSNRGPLTGNLIFPIPQYSVCVDLESANKPKVNRAGIKCVPKSCDRCKRRKAKCTKDGNGGCTSCTKAGLPCTRENMDLREKSTVSDVLETKRAAHHKAYMAAVDLVMKASDFVANPVSNSNIFDGVIASLTERRNANSDGLIQAVPTIARCVPGLGLSMSIDPGQIAPIPSANQTELTKPELKKHLDAYERASREMINNFRTAIVAMMTPINEWPIDQASSFERLELCVWVFTHNFDKIVQWGASSDWAQQLVKKWEAKNN
ncbi:hypothetical protein G7Z17_g7990 [Cylindrodendrum hubeiense]|uniref:Zn(2)-C6 fungal-type domain-containing protein n=1 Tax=Cylindrodendrum hubeiense TaxID=595255 RepID=A0A9P5L9F3_9HYPO|nr:hypothetical protein G7Z17_g7990 [Cylindrodendrum hubeiense]